MIAAEPDTNPYSNIVAQSSFLLDNGTNTLNDLELLPL